MISGVSYESVGPTLGISAATVRREVDNVLAQRTVDAPQRYVSLQMARLSNAMVAVTNGIDDVDLRVIAALSVLNSELDRYHTFALRSDASPRADVPELQKKAPKSLNSPARHSELHGDLRL